MLVWGTKTEYLQFPEKEELRQQKRILKQLADESNTVAWIKNRG